MTYFFSGVFILDDDGDAARAVCELYGGRAGAITTPMPATVVAFAADYEWFEPPASFEQSLIEFSGAFPALRFVRLETACWGGAIDRERGQVFANGEVVASEESEEDSIIVPLFAGAGVELSSGFLEPLTRDWFKGKGDLGRSTDRSYMRVALEAARGQIGRTAENPAVGCAARRPGSLGQAISCSATGDGGRPHAEEQVLNELGEDARGAVVYVTLEPCAQRSIGSTSCSDLLIAAGVSRVVIATRDPHPMAAGAGVERLCAAGIAVDFGLMEAEARAQNAAFFARWDKP